MPVLHVVMPVFNEVPTLGEILSRVLRAPLPAGWTIDVTMVDDGSREDAARVAREVARSAAVGAALNREHVRLVVHPENRGKGAALLTGFDHVLTRASDSDAVLVQDADLEYDPSDYTDLIHAMLEGPQPGRRAAVFGSRWNGVVDRRSTYRMLHALANRMLTAWSNRLTGLDVSDMECCYKLLPIPLLREVRPWLSEQRFGIEPQIAAALARAGATVVEVPVAYRPRSFAQGKKIRWTDGVHALTVIVRERFRKTPPKQMPATHVPDEGTP